MGVKLDDEKLILALKCCSKVQEYQDYDCSACPIREMLEGTQPPVTCCDSITMLLAAQRLEALTSTAANMLILSRLRQTNLIHFVEPMRIPTTTQQEHELAVNRRTGKPYVHDSQEIKNARMSFRAHLSTHRPPKPFMGGPLSLSVTWIFCDYEGNHKEREYKTTRPDTDNMIKMLKDEMTYCGFFLNDAHVAVEVNRKIWSSTFEGIIVDVAALPEVAIL